eukprot:3047206-Rhodomonas_salina.1
MDRTLFTKRKNTEVNNEDTTQHKSQNKVWNKRGTSNLTTSELLLLTTAIACPMPSERQRRKTRGSETTGKVRRKAFDSAHSTLVSSFCNSPSLPARVRTHLHISSTNK